MKEIWNQLENPEKKYRPHPFWAWNDQLDQKLCEFEIDEMEKAGMGGFFMHARTGLKTEYLSKEWMEVTKKCIEYASDKGMFAWGYDEDGWPSGFAGGEVQKACPESVIQWVEMREDGEIVFCENPGYVDLLNEKTTETFIRLTHEKYKENLGDEEWKKMGGFFTDEPQYRREKIPYSDMLERAFEQEYGYSIRENLIALFLDIENAEKIRYDFYRLVSKRFIENFSKKMYHWLEKEGLGYTGHLLHEESLLRQMQGTAGVMPHYQYMSIPGMDWLGRSVSSPLVPKQVASVAAQTGKEAVLSETFALCGWNVSFEELKWIAHWQIVNGVTLICQHLEGYTLRGVRKRDYPPSLFYQQPYWEQYRKFNDYLGRLGQLFSNAEGLENVCVIHPIRSAWISYTGKEEGPLLKLDQEFENVVTQLAQVHLPYHFVDEGMLAEMGRITEEGCLQMGNCKYQNVILPSMYCIDATTLELLEKMHEKGGKIFAVGTLPEYLEGRKHASLKEHLQQFVIQTDYLGLKEQIGEKHAYDICIEDEFGNEIKDIHVMSKMQNGKIIYFLVNMSQHSDYTAKIKMKGVSSVEEWNLWEYKKTQKQPVEDGVYGQILLKLHAMEATVLVCEQNIIKIPVEEQLHISKIDVNAITLDCAEYRIDQGDWQPKKAVIRIMRELLEQQKTAEVDLKFYCHIAVPVEKIGSVELVMESPEQYEISINGTAFSWKDQGFYRDSSFRKMDVSAYLQQGENEILLHTTFYQREKVYEVLFGENVLETELNKLTYDTELESIYLCGDFGVYCEESYEELERNAFSTRGTFYLGELPEYVQRGDFSKQGLLFYAGNLEVSQKLTLECIEDKKYVLDFEQKPDCAVMQIFVNGQLARIYAGGSLQTEITEFLHSGENEIRYQFGGTNRNLLGPHHFVLGESYSVGPNTFGDIGGWTEPEELQGKDIWTDSYCFVKYGF